MASEPSDFPSAPPPAADAKLRVLKKNVRGGVCYEVGLPPYVPGMFYAASALCVGAGLFGWKILPHEQAVALGFLFGLNAFITAMAGASIHKLKRPIEVGTGGFTIAGKTAPLARIDGVAVTRGPLCRLRVEAGTDSAEMMMGRKQAEWLKADIEYELRARRGQTPKKGAE
ncbi:MAG: hypothetical protein HZA03_10170 [Nitrospinae bacterium]|nr:hypothetical protein [Nitrospinota bacterium]